MRRWRGENDITLAHLAAAVGVHVSHLSMIETGERTPSLDLAAKLAAATKNAVSIEEFVTQ